MGLVLVVYFVVCFGLGFVWFELWLLLFGCSGGLVFSGLRVNVGICFKVCMCLVCSFRIWAVRGASLLAP